MSDKKIYNGFEFFDKLRERMYRDEKIVKAGKGLKLNDVNTLSVDNGDGIAFDDNDKVTVNNGNGIAFDDEGKVTVNGEELLATEEQAGTVYITETPDEWHDKDPDKIALNVVGFNKEKASLVHTINNVKTKLESLLQIKKAGSGLEFDEESGELSVNDAESEIKGGVYISDSAHYAPVDARKTALSIQGAMDLEDTINKSIIKETSEGLNLTARTSAVGKLLTLNTATDTTLGGVKVSNTINVEEPADNLVPNVVAIQDELDQYIYPAFEYIPMNYSNGLIFNKDESNLRIELGDGLKVNDSGGLSVETTDTIKVDTDLTLIPTLKALKPYRSEIIKSTHSAEIKEEQIYLSAGLMHIYVKYAFNQPETGNQVVLRIPITTLDEFSVRPKIPTYDQYVTSCVIQHNNTETLELARYTFMDTPTQNYYDFTVKPDNVTDGDIVILTVTVPVSALS